MVVRKGYKPLFIDNNTLYASKKNSLYFSEDFGMTFQFFSKYKAGFFESNSSIYNRVARGGIHSLIKLDNGGFIGVKRKAIIYKSQEENIFRTVFKIPRGSRPLNIIEDPVSKNIYFGEYFSNNDRDEVYIYSSSDGENWDKSYTFPKKSIRHIHGLFYDKYRKGIWVLTGDNDDESHLWFSNDQFKSLKSIKGNSQKTRAVSIIPTAKGLIVPMDTPREQNYIHFLNISDNTLEPIGDLCGSAFHCHSSEIMLISTVAEPSEVNKIDYAAIYSSEIGKDWKAVVKWKQDWLSNLSYRFFRYPEITFPAGTNNTNYIFAYGLGVSKYNDAMVRFDKAELI